MKRTKVRFGALQAEELLHIVNILEKKVLGEVVAIFTVRQDLHK